MKQRTKKVFAWVMTLAMLLSLVPATGLTALAAGSTPDYTIVLSGGEAYKNSVTDANKITDELVGLTYAEGVWSMTNFNFTTTAEIALYLKDQNTTFVVSGSNSITNGAGTNKSYVIYMPEDNRGVTIKGADSGINTLTFTSPGAATGQVSTRGMELQGQTAALSIGNNVTVTAKAGNSYSSYGVRAYSLTISGTGKLIAQSGTATYGAAVEIYTEPSATAKNTGEETSPTWSAEDCTYKNGDEIATDVTLTAATPGAITITAGSASKGYDGTPLTNSGYTCTGSLEAGDHFSSVTVTGSITKVGTVANKVTDWTICNAAGEDVTDSYSNIKTVDGTLTVTPADLAITVGTDLSTGLTYLYDGTATKVLSSEQYQVSGLAAGDKIINATVTTNSANAGTYDENLYMLSYDIVNAEGVSTKGSYITTENKNDIAITKRTITVNADSAFKVYDGTPLTCSCSAEESTNPEYQLLAGETISGGTTGTITHVGTTANELDVSNVKITKADESDSTMNYDFLVGGAGTLTVTPRGVLLQSSDAEKYYDGTPLQNREVLVTGFHYGATGEVIIDENAGFLAGDGCTYDFVNDNIVIDKFGNIIAWTVREQSGTKYGQTEVGTSKNEFNYNNFNSMYAGSYESDYTIMYGGNQEILGLSKDKMDLFGDLTVLAAEPDDTQEQSSVPETVEDPSELSVEIEMTDYSWTYDYQAKTNGYFDDGYTVIVTADGKKTEYVFKHNSEGGAIPLLDDETIVVTVTGEDGANTKVQHVGDVKQNIASYTIYRNGVDVTAEREEYYNISIDGGELKILPRAVTLTSASASKVSDGTALTANSICENGFIFGEGAVYEITGSRTEIGTSRNTFAISNLLMDTKETDYTFDMQEGYLMVVADEDAQKDIKKTDALIETNEAFNGDGFKTAESESIKNVLGATGFVDVKLADIETDGNSKVVGYTFDVTPYTAIGTAANTPLTDNVTFRLPINNPDGFAYANIYHEGSFLNRVRLGKTDTSIEVTAKDFSEYSYTLTNQGGGGGSSGGGGGSSTYQASVTTPTNGTIKLDKTNAVKGSTVTITVTPNEGYTVDTVTVKDASGNAVTTTKTSDTTYTFTMPASKVTVSATFKAEKEETPAPAVEDSNPFTDVKDSDFFYEPVLWAVDKGITSGVTATTFCPYDITTRAQMVTFLWRAAGSPEPASTTNPFTDVSESDYFYKAVLWGHANGYVKGISDTTFGPNLTVIRGQVVTFLARMAGVTDEATGYTHSFTDVPADAYYNNSIAWASQKGIANGTGATTFAPDQGCKRGEVVTFLYRNANQ